MDKLSKTLLVFLLIPLFFIMVTGCMGSNDTGPQADTAGSDNELYKGPGEDSMMISSSAFENGGLIPIRYTCDGENVNPSLEVENIPEGTESLVLLVDDPDSPSGSFTHWLVWNIPPGSQINENSIPGITGKNSFGQAIYGGPCPSAGTHRYHFKVFALDKELDLPGGSGIEQVEELMQGHILAQGQMTGKYGRA
ncbi:MAG: YbhB/YbcL family Raf kinase inhibitor-like protein [Methanolobus sp.]|uniref:YbhB/YbcL family Raf kinase inhibitor-like protein n=1 Tax=Methanolobus sp. TaxID=1874737 RepID=UPI00273164AD|nr:YbhB/YbcL family Raf kinase inhibitor-like protein [Methanolobus sp.]MDP2216174.1 YbhB/YbcL family Raf kinase inhibitor-like protein [Methanolobus sp.]